MNNNKDNKTKILLILCILLSIGFISTAFAYIRESTDEVVNTFTASGGGELFDKDNPDESKRGVFKLDESKAEITSNGTYELDEETRVYANEYKVLPSVNIPKDPKITIKNKTEVPAYLYLEVVNDCSGYFSFELEDYWLPLTDAVGSHSGNVYVYTPSTGTTLNAIPSLELGVIKSDLLITNSSLTESEAKNLTFYAYMAQTGIGNEAVTYNTCFPVTNN